MRPRWICAALWCSALAVAGQAAAGSPPRTPITIVLKFEGAYSATALQEMKREFERATKDSIPVEWRMREQMSGAAVADLVLFTFKGRCVMDTVPPPVYDETGPLAWTSTVDGAPQPFGQVTCDLIRNLVIKAMWGGDFSHGDQLLGRALGRVLAHEFYHMQAKTTAHAASGVTKPSLSGAQLISDSLLVDADSIELMERDRH